MLCKYQNLKIRWTVQSTYPNGSSLRVLQHRGTAVQTPTKRERTKRYAYALFNSFVVVQHIMFAFTTSAAGHEKTAIIIKSKSLVYMWC
jgi:hypothetical protein